MSIVSLIWPPAAAMILFVLVGWLITNWLLHILILNLKAANKLILIIQRCIGYTSISIAWDTDVKSMFFTMCLRSLVVRALERYSKDQGSSPGGDTCFSRQ